MPKRMLAIAVACLALAGCNTAPMRLDKPDLYKPARDCGKAGACEIFVEPLTGWAPYSVSVEFDRHGPRAETTRHMTWNAFPFLFEERGIVFDGRGSEVIRCERNRLAWWRMECTNSGEKGDFAYRIDLLGVAPVDPWVFNR